MNIGERIRISREASKISQKSLGQLLGLSDKAISAYESGRTVPTLSTLSKISKIVNRPLTYFFIEDHDIASLIDTLESMEQILKNISGELKEMKKIINQRIQSS